MSNKNRPSPNHYRSIYRKYKGPIPAGYHIHHIDGNPWNNHSDNLVALTPEEHYKVHLEQGDLQAAALLKGYLDERPDYRNDYPVYGDSMLRYMNPRWQGYVYTPARWPLTDKLKEQPEIVLLDDMDVFESDYRWDEIEKKSIYYALN